MKLKKLILARNKRLSLKHINYIELTPHDPVQLILGTNGVGKSTLIFECTPLPANAHDYHKDGFKEAHFYHNGSYYICKSEFEPKARFSIKKDDTWLTEHGTISVYREIIEQEFGIVQEMHDVLTMQERFTNMSTSTRRYWLTKLANNDFNYVIGVYNKLKTKHNEISGAVKTLKKRLVMETEKIVDIDFQNALQKEVDELYVNLNHMLEIRKPLDETPEELNELTRVNAQKMMEASKTLIRNVRANDLVTSTSYEDIEDRINAAISTQRTGAVLSDQYMKDIAKLDESISALEKTGQNNIQDMLQKILRLQMLQAEAEKQIQIPISVQHDPEQISMALANVDSTLTELSDNLPSNQDRHFSRATYTVNSTLLEQLLQSKVRTENELNDLQARKKHQELHLNTEGVECPQCQFKWHLGYSEKAHKEVLAKIEEKSEFLAAVVKDITAAQTKNTEILEYFAQFKRYTQLVDNWKVLSDLWDFFEKNDTIFNAPTSITSIVERFTRGVQMRAESRKHQKDIDETKNLIDLAEKVVDLDIDKLRKQREEFDSRLFIVSKDINVARNHQNEWLRLKADKQAVDKLDSAIKYHMQEHSSLHSRLVEATRRQIFNDCVRSMKSTLARKELAIQEIRGQRAIITDIEHQINFLSADEQALKLLVEELSPKDGLIAEGILGFIRVFIEQLNKEIARVWSYQLEVQACSLDDGSSVDLDYKFPVQAGNIMTPDISKCSAGQMEMINLAFLPLFMSYLGLQDFPVMLDEPAVNMDNAHRIAATLYIKNLVEKRSFSQLFMVNHYDSIYGAFTNAQVTVMCEDNVVLPKDCIYNKHTIIR